MAGQMTLFDFVAEEDKKDFEIRMPDVEEFDKETILSFEKEVLGIYLSGHPLDQDRAMMEKTITARTTDFQPDEETGLPHVQDKQKVIVGGMITEKTVKYTRNNQMMAFLTIEDLVGSMEIVVFPRDYERWQSYLQEESRVFIQGRVSAEDDKASKLILEKVKGFDEMPAEIWIQFADRDAYKEKEEALLSELRQHPGTDTVAVFLRDVRAVKKLPAMYRTTREEANLEALSGQFGKENVKIVHKAWTGY